MHEGHASWPERTLLMSIMEYLRPDGAIADSRVPISGLTSLKQ